MKTRATAAHISRRAGANAVTVLEMTNRPLGAFDADLVAMLVEATSSSMTACARRSEGQPDWKSRLPSGRMPAPPHDASGHTWHHPDDVLFRITREGPAAVVGGGYESDMPGFAGVLSDGDIDAVLDFIKSTWPERERQYQAELSRRKRQASQ